MILTTRWRWSLCLTAVVFILLYYSLSLNDQNFPFSEINNQSTFSQGLPEVKYPSSGKIFEEIEKIKNKFDENKEDDIKKNVIKTNKDSATSKYFNLLNIVLNMYLNDLDSFFS